MALARWKDMCIDAADARALGTFWGQLLGLTVVEEDDGDVVLRGERDEQTIWINEVPEAKSVKHRVHIDVEAASVDSALALGATMVLPASESGFGWTVLTDPEGGELCVFEREAHPAGAPARLFELIVDTATTATSAAQARWWAKVLEGEARDDERGFSYVERVPSLPFDKIDFIPVPEPKSVKNRIHWDITSDDLEALEAQGARVLVHPTETTHWHVCQDLDGNEFCVFTSD
ncbi:MAG: VOC family protein [Acidimicrobiales bacterium]